MTEPKDLLLINEQLRRSNRFWKALALAACAFLVLVAVVGFVSVAWERVRAERARRQAQVLVEAHAAVENAQKAANPRWPK
jgi:hypothetical protein